MELVYHGFFSLTAFHTVSSAMFAFYIEFSGLLIECCYSLCFMASLCTGVWTSSCICIVRRSLLLIKSCNFVGNVLHWLPVICREPWGLWSASSLSLTPSSPLSSSSSWSSSSPSPSSTGAVDAQQLGLGSLPTGRDRHRHREEEENLKYHDCQVLLIIILPDLNISRW